jgi:hypothetical protein
MHTCQRALVGTGRCDRRRCRRGMRCPVSGAVRQERWSLPAMMAGPAGRPADERLAVRGHYDGLGPDKLPSLGTAVDEGVGIYTRRGACVEVGTARRMGHPIKNGCERIADRVPLRALTPVIVTFRPCPSAWMLSVWLFGGGPGLYFDFARLSCHVPTKGLLCANPICGNTEATAKPAIWRRHWLHRVARWR